VRHSAASISFPSRTRRRFRAAGAGAAGVQGQLFTLVGQEYRPQEGRVLTLNGIRIPQG
jgi:hypothetical protein